MVIEIEYTTIGDRISQLLQICSVGCGINKISPVIGLYYIIICETH